MLSYASWYRWYRFGIVPIAGLGTRNNEVSVVTRKKVFKDLEMETMLDKKPQSFLRTKKDCGELRWIVCILVPIISNNWKRGRIEKYLRYEFSAMRNLRWCIQRYFKVAGNTYRVVFNEATIGSFLR